MQQTSVPVSKVDFRILNWFILSNQNKKKPKGFEQKMYSAIHKYIKFKMISHNWLENVKNKMKRHFPNKKCTKVLLLWNFRHFFLWFLYEKSVVIQYSF